MRKVYEDVVNEWESDKRLIREVSEMCEEIADDELATQARIYERVISSLEREIAALNAKILTNCLTESERETRDARNAWG